MVIKNTLSANKFHTICDHDKIDIGFVPQPENCLNNEKGQAMQYHGKCEDCRTEFWADSEIEIISISKSEAVKQLTCGRCGMTALTGKFEGDYCHRYHNGVNGAFCNGKIITK